jgi:hypothetical protein
MAEPEFGSEPVTTIHIDDLPDITRSKVLNLVRWIKKQPVTFNPNDEKEKQGFMVVDISRHSHSPIHRVIAKLNGDDLLIYERNLTSRGGSLNDVSKIIPVYIPPCWVFCDKHSWEIIDIVEEQVQPSFPQDQIWNYEEIFRQKSCNLTPMAEENATFCEANISAHPPHKKWDNTVIEIDSKTKKVIRQTVYVIEKFEEPPGTPVGESWFKQYDKKHPGNIRLVIRYSDVREVKRIIVRDDILDRSSLHPELESLFKPLLNEMEIPSEKGSYDKLNVYDMESSTKRYKSSKYSNALSQGHHFQQEYGFPSAYEWEELFVEIKDASEGVWKDKFIIELR